MNDDRKPTEAPDPIHVEHWCSHPGCQRWGSFGYDRGKGRTDWFCIEHRPAASTDA